MWLEIYLNPLNLANHKILIVDDDQEILTILQILLTQNNYNVKSIYRWESVETTVEMFAPDLIILDISLAGADGRVICRTLKTRSDTMHIPIILFSANLHAEKTFTEYYANDFIAKPFEIEDLINKVLIHLPTDPALV